MCGISGAFAISGPLTDDARASVVVMNGALAHRGPDGDGFFNAPRAALAQRRLAIIDRAGGRQPMANEDGSCWITFNGEIYNHKSLKPQLEARGHLFRTASDTEVILHAWEEYGTACVDRLEGMFAFAIYDGRRQEFFAARDRLGKKPFFYTMLDDVLWFASELPALSHAAGWKGDVDLSALEGYLSLGYFLAPATPFRDVFKLMPGHWLQVANGRVKVQQYWDVTEFDTDDRPTDALLKEIDETLRQAVFARLESEVPLGAFLSGGIDSGLVVSYMAEALGRVTTTSVGFDDGVHNELDAAAITAARFGTDHHVEIVQPAIEATIDKVIAGFDEPFADSSAIPTYHVAGMARRHVTVVLSGDGGDEAFGGYDFRYVPHALEDKARRALPGSVGRAAAGVLGEYWPRSPRLPRPLRLATIFENISRDAASAYYSDLCMVKPHVAR